MTGPTEETLRFRFKAGCLIVGTLLVIGLIFAIRVLPMWVWPALLGLIVVWLVWAERRAPRALRRLRRTRRAWKDGQRLAFALDLHYLPHGGRKEIDGVLDAAGGRVASRRRDRDYKITSEGAAPLSEAQALEALALVETHEGWTLKHQSAQVRDGFVVSLALTDGRRLRQVRAHMPQGAHLELIRGLEALAPTTDVTDSPTNGAP